MDFIIPVIITHFDHNYYLNSKKQKSINDLLNSPKLQHLSMEYYSKLKNHYC